MHPLEDQVVLLVLAQEVEDLGDVRVGQDRADARLFLEEVAVELLLCQVRVHLLDGDCPPEPPRAVVDRTPHGRHAAAPCDLDQLVASADPARRPGGRRNRRQGNLAHGDRS